MPLRQLRRPVAARLLAQLGSTSNLMSSPEQGPGKVVSGV